MVKIIFPILLMALSFLVEREVLADDSQYQIKTKYTYLVFNSVEDMVVFNRKINYPSGSFFKRFFSNQSAAEAKNELVEKVDLLFEKVLLILGMDNQIKKIRVRLLSNEEQLEEVFKKIFQKEKNVRAWYVYELNSVFLHVGDVNAGMLAHELGHAIIDHFFSVQPPRATAEILTGYVDDHLYEEVKKYD
ncbi:hypothetical protein ACFL0S_02185 [Thermodesulfobacteriota bacterium]